ncbi:MAG: hypothetical protein Q9179_001652 [Wetmoreana sp. 5 TL-2023]
MTNRRNGSQPHIPRLTYRHAPSTASVSEDSIITVRTQSSATSNFTYATSPSTSSFTGSPRSSHFPDGAPSPLSLDSAPDEQPSSSSLPSRPAKEPKKKPSSIFKFFSVKEPSTQAFEAYQEQMKKRGTTQSGQANAVGLPGVSSAKLPPTVPKVNSKWDGVPQAVKDKSKGTERDIAQRQPTSSSATRPLHTSHSTGSNRTTSTKSSTSSTSSTHSGVRVNGKLRLDDSSGSLSDLYGWETGPQSSGSSTVSLPLDTRPSTTSAPPFSRDGSLSFFNRPPTIPETCSEPSATTPPPLDLSSNSPSPIILPSPPSPRTPNDSAHELPLSLLHDAQYNGIYLKESSNTNKKAALLTSSGARVLGPPVSATRRPKPTPSPAGEATELRFPTDAPKESPSSQPSSISKRPTWGSSRAPLPQPHTLNVEKAGPPPTPVKETKSKRAQMMSIFSKDS